MPKHFSLWRRNFFWGFIQFMWPCKGGLGTTLHFLDSSPQFLKILWLHLIDCPHKHPVKIVVTAHTPLCGWVHYHEALALRLYREVGVQGPSPPQTTVHLVDSPLYGWQWCKGPGWLFSTPLKIYAEWPLRYLSCWYVKKFFSCGYCHGWYKIFPSLGEKTWIMWLPENCRTLDS